MLAARRTCTWLVSLAAVAALAGCRGADPAEELVLVPRAVEEEARQAPRYELALTVADRELELWLPLPISDAFQVVHSVVVEVGAPGTYELTTTETGDRVVHVTAGGATLRALVERTLIEASEPLPTSVADLPPTLDAAQWVDAARSRGITARVARGVERTAAGATVACRWPEALIGGDWLPVDVAARRCALAAARVRLDLDLVRAVSDGTTRPLEPALALTPR